MGFLRPHGLNKVFPAPCCRGEKSEFYFTLVKEKHETLVTLASGNRKEIRTR